MFFSHLARLGGPVPAVQKPLYLVQSGQQGDIGGVVNTGEHVAAVSQSDSQDTQIVVQWLVDRLRSSTQAELDLQEVWRAEDTLAEESTGLFEVEGHDFRENTVNVFLHTSDPDATITRILEIFEHAHLKPGIRIGLAQKTNSAPTDLTYSPAYPPDLEKLEIK